jgi:hypothetical protein
MTDVSAVSPSVTDGIDPTPQAVTDALASLNAACGAWPKHEIAAGTHGHVTWSEGSTACWIFEHGGPKALDEAWWQGTRDATTLWVAGLVAAWLIYQLVAGIPGFVRAVRAFRRDRAARRT